LFYCRCGYDTTETMGESKYQNSAQAYAEACRFVPGGVNSPVRAFGAVEREPLFIASARGSKLYDIDGNEYIDYVCSWGPMILGHAHPAVTRAVAAAAEKGSSFGAPTTAETSLARRIVEAFESIEKVRMVSSGTEAVMTAVRLARAFTNRDFIIKMAGCYHGHSDCLLAEAGSGVAEHTRAGSAGVPDNLTRTTVVIAYNDIEAAEAAFRRYEGKIAAVVIEPVAANMGVITPVEGYLQALRDLCQRSGSVLIFDEVITGFRLCFGGVQRLFAVNADITCLGKIIGGGLPAAALGGRAEIMDMLAPLGKVYQAGTLSGNPIATAAANATLDVLAEDGCYSKLNAMAELLEEGLTQAARRAKVAVTINRVGSLMSCFFTARPVHNLRDVRSTDTARFKRFFAAMLDRGVYLASSPYEAMFLSLAHSRKDIERTVEAAEAGFHEAAKQRSAGVL